MERAKLIPMRMYLAFTALRDGESGQAMVEYALILALVSVAAVGILSTLGTLGLVDLQRDQRGPVGQDGRTFAWPRELSGAAR